MYLLKLFIVLLLFFTISVVSYGQNNIPFISHFYPQLTDVRLDESFKFIDFNNDGKDDIITHTSSQFSGASSYIVKNNNFIFDALHPISIGSNVMLTVDWDGDNLVDLITNNFELKLNLGSFNFDTIQPLNTGSLYYISGTEDINSDGFIDLYGWNSSRDSIVIAFNQSGGVTLQDSLIFMPYGAYYNASSKILFGDYDGDGLIDLFYRNSNSIYLYEHTGGYVYSVSDSLEVASNFTIDLPKTSFFLRDLNNDGQKELVFTSNHNATWDVYLYNSNLGAKFNQRFTGDYYYQSTNGYGGTGIQPITQIYDVDQNGQDDILVGNSIFYNNGNFSFNEIDLMTPPKLYKSGIKCTDYDGDGNTDICFPYNPYGQLFLEFSKITNTGAQSSGSISQIWPLIESTNDYAVDYDNDGDVDLIGVSSKVYFKENINDTLYTRVLGDLGVSASTSQLLFSDFNGDQYEDFISMEGSNISRLFLNDANNGYTSSLIGGSSINSYGVMDSDNDGINEAFFIRFSGTSSVQLLKYKFGVGTVVVLSWNDWTPADSKMKFGDINQDGFQDIVVSNTAAGGNKIRVFLNDGMGSFSLNQTINTGTTAIIGVLDVNGDFYPDVLAHASGTQFLFTNDGNGLLIYSGIYTTVNNPSSFNLFKEFTFDYNNDNTKDLLFFGNSSNTNFAYTNTGATISTSTGSWLSSDVRRIKDVDLDGDMDVLSNIGWYENTSNNLFNVVGYLYYDIDLNGMYSSAIDVSIQNGLVQIPQLSVVVSTDSNGYYNFPVGNISSSYTVEWMNSFSPSFSVNSSPYPAIAVVDSLQTVDTVNIGIINSSPQIVGSIDNTLVGNRCNEVGRLFLSYSNFTPETANAQVDLKLANNTSFISSSEVAIYNSMDSLSWNFVSIPAFSTNILIVDAMMPSTAFMGDTMLFFSKLTLTDLNGSVNYYYDTLRTLLTCAYDPNDKTISDNGLIYFGDSTFVFTDEIEYLIRFQNTGNDTAQNIMIFDHINELFDINSFRPVSASHSYSLEIDSNRNLSVHFDNIFLPDSTTDFINSMGFVKFVVRYDSLSPTFVPVKNTAQIYFDFNPPILTNQNLFFRTNCKNFVNLGYDTSNICAPDSLLFVNNDYDFPLKYTWVVGTDTSILSTNTAVLPIDSAGNIPISIRIENNFCSFDTIAIVSIATERPNILLSVQDSAFLCPQGVISSNMPTYWNGNQSSSLQSLSVGNYSTEISALALSSPTCKDSVSVYVNVIGSGLSLHELDTGSVYASFDFCRDTLLTIQSNVDTLIWKVYLYDVFGASTLIMDTTNVFSVFLSSNSQRLRIIAYKDTLGCTLQHITVLNLNNNAPIILEPQYNAFCNVASPQLAANTLVDWYVDSSYVETGFSTSSFVDNSIVIAKNYCGYTDASVVTIVNQQLLAQYPDSLFLNCWEDTLMLQDSFFHDSMIVWRGHFNSINYFYTETDSISHFYLPAQYSNLSLTAQYTYRNCPLENTIQIIKSNLTHQVINNGNVQLTTDNGARYQWYYADDFINFNPINYDSITSVSNNGFYFYKDTLYCVNYSDTVFINSFSTPAILFVSQEICSNDSTMFLGNYVSAQGVYVDSVSNATINILDLSINQSYYTFFSSPYSYCPGNVSLYDGSVVYLDHDTIYRTSFFTVKGCDSIIEQEILVAESYYVYDTAYVCLGSDFVRPNGNILANVTTSISVVDNLYSISSCDSIIETFVDVVSTYPNYNPLLQQLLICAGSPYTFPDGSYTSAILNDTIQYSYLTTINAQCDSVIKTIFTVSIIDTTVIENGDQLIAIQQNASLQWIDCNDNTVIGTNQSVIINSSGSYALVVNFSNCSDTSSCYFIQASGIDEFYADVSIYPNPSKGKFNVNFDVTQPTISIYVFDVNGKLVVKKEFKGRKEVIINQFLETGVYFIRIMTESTIYNVPLIIKN